MYIWVVIARSGSPPILAKQLITATKQSHTLAHEIASLMSC